MNRCTNRSDQAALLALQHKLKNASAFHQVPGAFNKMKVIEIDVFPTKLSQGVFKFLAGEVMGLLPRLCGNDHLILDAPQTFANMFLRGIGGSRIDEIDPPFERFLDDPGTLFDGYPSLKSGLR